MAANVNIEKKVKAQPSKSAGKVIARVAAVVSDVFGDVIRDELQRDIDSLSAVACLVIIRGLVSSKHIPRDNEIDTAMGILLDLYRRCGVILSTIQKSRAVALFNDYRELIRCSEPSNWKARG